MIKINRKMLYAATLVGTALLASCSKDKKTTPDNTDNTITIAGKWRLEGNMSDRPIETQNGDTVTDLYAITPDCQKDNFYQFDEAGTYSVNEGPTKCNANDPQILVSGTWKLADGTLTIDNTPGIYTRKDATHFTLVVSSGVSYNGTEYVATLSFVKQ